MSTPYERNPDDPLALVAFDEDLMDATSAAARDNPRARWITRFHGLDEPFQRMLNAVEPQSYTRPHRHLDPPKSEVFVALRGSALIVRFADDGIPVEGVVIADAGPARGIEIPPGAWHCLVSLEEGTVLFEAKEGPYVQATDKDFAPWAPPEDDREAGLAFIASLRAHFGSVLPAVAAMDEIAAEEDEIL
jgi:cupin fold WbuC family metalloprotein